MRRRRRACRQARSEASRLLAAAREDAAAAAAERRRVVLAAAEDDAAEISAPGSRDARPASERTHGSSRAAVVEAALALILPADDESEA